MLLVMVFFVLEIQISKIKHTATFFDFDCQIRVVVTVLERMRVINRQPIVAVFVKLVNCSQSLWTTHSLCGLYNLCGLASIVDYISNRLKTKGFCRQKYAQLRVNTKNKIDLKLEE